MEKQEPLQASLPTAPLRLGFYWTSHLIWRHICSSPELLNFQWLSSLLSQFIFCFQGVISNSVLIEENNAFSDSPVCFCHFPCNGKQKWEEVNRTGRKQERQCNTGVYSDLVLHEASDPQMESDIPLCTSLALPRGGRESGYK